MSDEARRIAKIRSEFCALFVKTGEQDQGMLAELRRFAESRRGRDPFDTALHSGVQHARSANPDACGLSAAVLDRAATERKKRGRPPFRASPHPKDKRVFVPGQRRPGRQPGTRIVIIDGKRKLVYPDALSSPDHTTDAPALV